MARRCIQYFGQVFAESDPKRTHPIVERLGRRRFTWRQRRRNHHSPKEVQSLVSTKSRRGTTFESIGVPVPTRFSKFKGRQRLSNTNRLTIGRGRPTSPSPLDCADCRHGTAAAELYHNYNCQLAQGDRLLVRTIAAPLSTTSRVSAQSSVAPRHGTSVVGSTRRNDPALAPPPLYTPSCAATYRTRTLLDCPGPYNPIRRNVALGISVQRTDPSSTNFPLDQQLLVCGHNHVRCGSVVLPSIVARQGIAPQGFFARSKSAIAPTRAISYHFVAFSSRQWRKHHSIGRSRLCAIQTILVRGLRMFNFGGVRLGKCSFNSGRIGIWYEIRLIE